MGVCARSVIALFYSVFLFLLSFHRHRYRKFELNTRASSVRAQTLKYIDMQSRTMNIQNMFWIRFIVCFVHCLWVWWAACVCFQLLSVPNLLQEGALSWQCKPTLFIEFKWNTLHMAQCPNTTGTFCIFVTFCFAQLLLCSCVCVCARRACYMRENRLERVVVYYAMDDTIDKRSRISGEAGGRANKRTIVVKVYYYHCCYKSKNRCNGIENENDLKT